MCCRIMYRLCKSVAPTVYGQGRWALRPVVQQRNFWGFPRPTDFRVMLRDIDRQMEHFDRDVQSFIRNAPAITSLLPRALSLPVEAVETAGNTYRVNIDVSGFKPEDIKLALKDRLLTVEAKMEQKSEDGGTRFYQEMSRAYTIPENVDITNLKSLLTSDGVLAIEGPLSEEASKPHEIPIAHTEEIAAK